jgi:phage-related protein
MFKEINQARTEAVIDYIRMLPVNEQKAIIKSISKPGKKLTKKQKKTQEVLKGIAEGLREIKEAKRGGKQLMNLDDALNEL